jgi:serine/threonine protein kinase
MSLTPGTRLGSYEIGKPIGAGGMGEVYRAHDTSLERDVAIKVLPESFASDASRVAHFEQEAKTLAALNHPNIAHIYGIERASAETPGADTKPEPGDAASAASAENVSAETATTESASTSTALVMELVEGPMLADRIEQGPLATDAGQPVCVTDRTGSRLPSVRNSATNPG